MTTPRIGLVVAEPPGGPAGWRDLGRFGASAESAGADSVWLTDHLFWHRPTVEPLAGLALLAAGTERATVGSCVLQLPLRSPAAVAKSAAFLASLAPDRFVLGVGVGEHQGEYSRAGEAERFADRGRALDEGIAAVRAAWDSDGGYRIDPPGPVPIWVGGRSRAARRRAVAMADGWVPHLVRAGEIGPALMSVDGELEAAGRDRGRFTVAAVLAVAVGTAGGGQGQAAGRLGDLYGLPAHAFDRVVAAGPAEAVAEEVTALGALGVDEVILFPPGDDPVGELAAVRRALGA